MKTLVVSYTPRIGSYTKVLVDRFVSLAHEKTAITHLDLVATPPDLLLAKNIQLVMEWNNGKREFNTEESAILSNHHNLLEQFLQFDKIVLASPIYNFSLPATVKAWVDAIVVSDKTFSFDPNTGFSGLCSDKKAVTIMVSGFDYHSKSHNINEFASGAIKANFDFMGIPLKQISAYGVDENRPMLDSILKKAEKEIENLVEHWYE